MRGPLLLLAALGLFAALDTNSKLLSGHYPAAQVVGARYAALLALLLLARLLVPGAGGPLGSRRPGAQVLRAAGMLCASFGFLLSLRGLSLAEGYLVFSVAPFLTLALSALVLRERVPVAAWGWCAAGFGGVLLAMWPGLAASDPGAVGAYLWGILAAGCYAGVLTLNRALRDEPGTARLLLWGFAPGLAATAPFLVAEWVAPTPLDAAALAVNGVLAGAAALCLAGAFRHAPASRLAPLEFSALAWAVVFDLAVWGVPPGPWTLAGAAVVVLAGVMSQRALSPSRDSQGALPPAPPRGT